MNLFSFLDDFIEIIYVIVCVVAIFAFIFFPIALSFIFDSKWCLLLFFVTIPIVFAFFGN